MCLAPFLFLSFKIQVFCVLQVLQNILETENEYAKELQTMLSNYLRPLQASEK